MGLQWLTAADFSEQGRVTSVIGRASIRIGDGHVAGKCRQPPMGFDERVVIRVEHPVEDMRHPDPQCVWRGSTAPFQQAKNEVFTVQNRTKQI